MNRIQGTPADWDITLPGETATAKVIRTVLASIALTLEESGHPLTAEQQAVFDEATRRAA